MTLTWSNAELKARTDLVLVPAQGADTIIVIDDMLLEMVYGGNNAFSGTPTMTIKYNGVNANPLTPGATFYNQTQNTYLNWDGFLAVAFTAANFVNKDLSISLGAGLTGNAANDNFMRIKVTYSVINANI